ncbi:hypothetical protein IP90_01184 [Luteimonas cucumeris]|uniref:Uncharacterized protein n=1 Tax=Luteimonas cucumeris TaxID=985012 RepID=A0A562LBM7_9GAMM|nr:hypothetical protein [Luteimonas cucumeris]TWI05041.1 hypothetical protein IP90_01184 [Luteimonas cucumeris]
MEKRILALCGAIAITAVAHAQDTQPLPSHGEFIEQACVPAMLQQLGDAEAQHGFARAACECSYRLLSDRPTMTRERFEAAATVCRAEYEQDGAAFVRKYAE